MLRRLRAWLRPQAVRELSWSYDPAPELPGTFGPIPVDVAIHRLASERLALIVPGWDGARDGYEGKYRRMAEALVAREVAAVVRASNRVVSGLAFENTSRHQLRAVAARARAEARWICGRPRPRLLCVGYSAGGSAAAALASELDFETLLLIAPSEDAGEERMKAGLADYTGALFVTVGADDEVVQDFPREVAGWAPRASRVELVVVPDCDHQFRGERNGERFQRAPLWAFAGEPYLA